MERISALRKQSTFICPLEEVALVAPYICPELFPIFANRDVLYFADNTAANGAAIKGYSSSPDLARLVGPLHFRLAASSTRLWIEFVPSELDIADGPSRGDFSQMVEAGAIQVPFYVSIASFVGSLIACELVFFLLVSSSCPLRRY